MGFNSAFKGLTCLPTTSKEQRPWEANRSSASEEIPHILWNPKGPYRIYKCPPPVPSLSQINPVHALHPTSWRTILLQVPNLMSLFHCSGRAEVSVQSRGTCICFVMTIPVFTVRSCWHLAQPPQTGVPPLVGCPRLLIQHIRWYPPYWRSFPHPRPKDVPCRGDRDPFIMGLLIARSLFCDQYRLSLSADRAFVLADGRPCARDLLYCWAEKARMLCWCNPACFSSMNSAIIEFRFSQRYYRLLGSLGDSFPLCSMYTNKE